MIKSLDEVLSRWERGERVYYTSLRANKMPLGAYNAEKVGVVTDLFYRSGVKFGVFK